MSRKIIVAISTEQAIIHAESLGLAPAGCIVITTDGRCRRPPGVYPLPDDVAYAPGWEMGTASLAVLDDLYRTYRKRIPAAVPIAA